MPDDHTFCRILLQETRKEARKAGITVPRLSSWRMDPISRTSEPYFEIFDANTKGREKVWEGYACCGWNARAEAISVLIDRRSDTK